MRSACAARYLLAIYELSDGGAAVRSVDIARRLRVSRASVVKSLKLLAEAGMVQKEYYGNVQLTALGVRESNRIYTEYTLLCAFFHDYLHISSEAAGKDAAACLCALTGEGKERMIELALRCRHARAGQG